MNTKGVWEGDVVRNVLAGEVGSVPGPHLLGSWCVVGGTWGSCE